MQGVQVVVLDAAHFFCDVPSGGGFFAESQQRVGDPPHGRADHDQRGAVSPFALHDAGEGAEGVGAANGGAAELQDFLVECGWVGADQVRNGCGFDRG